jgi:hypothetical protein
MSGRKRSRPTGAGGLPAALALSLPDLSAFCLGF